MTESNLRDYRDATLRAVSPNFTATVFAGIGVDRYTICSSAIGDVYVAWSAPGVSAVRLAGDERTFEAWYGERFGRRTVPAVEDDPISSAARAKLRGEDVTVPIDLRDCSPFEQRVLHTAAEIHRGNARPYRWLAREIGAPDATRAVGNALGQNPVPLLIPCHRVIRTDCSVGGYVFGSEAKTHAARRRGARSRRGREDHRSRLSLRCQRRRLLLLADLRRHRDPRRHDRLLRPAHPRRSPRPRPSPCTSCRPIAA